MLLIEIVSDFCSYIPNFNHVETKVISKSEVINRASVLDFLDDPLKYF